jgi:hypothetical protein
LKDDLIDDVKKKEREEKTRGKENEPLQSNNLTSKIHSLY